MLHVAIQGYFREWFVQTAQYKQITDLVKIMDHEFWKHYSFNPLFILRVNINQINFNFTSLFVIPYLIY